MSIAELEQEWISRNVLAENEEWDSLREESAPLYREALDTFLAGDTDVATFRTSIDSLSRSHAGGASAEPARCS